METKSSYPWAHYLGEGPSHPQDGTMGVFDTIGAAFGNDPMLGGQDVNCSPPLKHTSPQNSYETPADNLFISNLPDLFSEAFDLIQSKHPDLSLTSDDLLTSPDAVHPLSSATEAPQSQRSSAISVVGENVVAELDCFVPFTEDELPLCADDFKTYSHLGTSAGVPISPKSGHVGYEGEIAVPACNDSAKMESKCHISHSHMLKEPLVGVPASAKSGSQAIDYIDNSAVLETYGIPAVPQLAPTVGLPSPGTELPPIHGTPTLLNQTGTINMDPKATTVAHELKGYTLLISQQPGTVLKTGVPLHSVSPTLCLPNPSGTLSSDLHAVPSPLTAIFDPQSGTLRLVPKDSIVPANHGSIKLVPSQTSTHNIDPSKISVPGETSGTSVYVSELAGNIDVDTSKISVSRKGTGTINSLSPTLGTPQSTTSQNTVPEITEDDSIYSDTVPTSLAPEKPSIRATESADNTDTNNEVKKPRKRRRKKAEEESGGQRKVRKYEQEPLDDATEERKRRDAIRSKSIRERNKQMMADLQRRVEEVEEEKNQLEKEKKQMIGEVEGRRAWERDVLYQLRTEYGIVVAPFGTSGLPPQPALTSPSNPTR